MTRPAAQRPHQTGPRDEYAPADEQDQPPPLRRREIVQLAIDGAGPGERCLEELLDRADRAECGS